MSRDSFYKLLRILKPHLERNSEMAKRAGREIVSPAIHFAVTLRLFADASYLDVISVYNQRAPFHQVFEDTCDAILSVLCFPGLSKSETAL